jgi:hypothetical protein
MASTAAAYSLFYSDAHIPCHSETVRSMIDKFVHLAVHCEMKIIIGAAPPTVGLLL